MTVFINGTTQFQYLCRGECYLPKAVHDGDKIALEINCKERTLRYFQNDIAIENVASYFEFDKNECEYCFVFAFYGATDESIDFQYIRYSIEEVKVTLYLFVSRLFSFSKMSF